jgi:hypothetical protein
MALKTQLIDTTPDTLETLRQADSFMAMAQDENRSDEERYTFLQMANFRYQKVLVRVDVNEPDTVYGSEGKND